MKARVAAESKRSHAGGNAALSDTAAVKSIHLGCGRGSEQSDGFDDDKKNRNCETVFK